MSLAIQMMKWCYYLLVVCQEKNIAAVIAALPAIVASKPNVRLCIAGGGPEREIGKHK